MARRRTLGLITAGIQKNGKPVDLPILQQVVKNHNAQSRAPISLGHPGEGADKFAALGRVDYPRIEGDELVVELVYTPEMEALEDSGKFEGFSAGIYPRPDNGEYYLHHVAALGQLPPAADIQTKDVVELSDFHADQVIALSCSIKSESFMNEQEKKAFKDEMKEMVKTTLTETLAASKPATEKKPPEGKPEDKENATDPNVVALQKEVSAMQESTKADRISQITELADSKGLSKEEKDPLIAMLKARPAVELCDNSDGGIFATTRAMLGARQGVSATGPDNPAGDLFKPLEFSDHKGGSTKVEHMGDLAMKSGF